MGTGSAGLSAVQSGRKFIGEEIDEKYFAIAEEKLKNIEVVIP